MNENLAFFDFKFCSLWCQQNISYLCENTAFNHHTKGILGEVIPLLAKEYSACSKITSTCLFTENMPPTENSKSNVGL